MLAAGRASRFGATKQLASFDGLPLVTRAAGVCAEVFGDRSLLVVGHDWSAVATAGSACRFFAINEHHASGIGSSIAAGVRRVRHAAAAVVILFADQPLIAPGDLENLIGAWSGAADHIVASAFADTLGPPVLMPQAAFAELSLLDGDRGARDIVASGRYRLTKVPIASAAADVDTPEDLAGL